MSIEFQLIPVGVNAGYATETGSMIAQYTDTSMCDSYMRHPVSEGLSTCLVLLDKFAYI